MASLLLDHSQKKYNLMDNIKDTVTNTTTLFGTGSVVMGWNESLTLVLLLTGIVFNIVRIVEIRRRKKKDNQKILATLEFFCSIRFLYSPNLLQVVPFRMPLIELRCKSYCLHNRLILAPSRYLARMTLALSIDNLGLDHLLLPAIHYTLY